MCSSDLAPYVLLLICLFFHLFYFLIECLHNLCIQSIVVAGILAAAGLICRGIAYYQYYQDAHAGQEYEKIKEKVVTEEPKKPEETPKSTVEIPIDFQTLQNMNPDIYAWNRTGRH